MEYDILESILVGSWVCFIYCIIALLLIFCMKKKKCRVGNV
uniref:Uncharacterized protein n=1 Tax=viral metagenome TaxID=1070528 RepID=A0A6C0L1P6_9ZZZZ